MILKVVTTKLAIGPANLENNLQNNDQFGYPANLEMTIKKKMAIKKKKIMIKLVTFVIFKIMTKLVISPANLEMTKDR